MKRSQFVKKATLLAIAAPAIPMISCSNDSDPSPPLPPLPTTNCLDNGTTSSITTNHGHGLVVTKEDIENAVDKTYSIQGTSTHDHSVTITASQFTTLQSNKSIDVTSTDGGGHSHNVTVSCA